MATIREMYGPYIMKNLIPPKPSMVEEISCMMHGFGDAQTPNPDTVKLVEDIVRTQIRDMLDDATRFAARKRLRIITIEDIVFLLRKDRAKMQRLLRVLNYKKRVSAIKLLEAGKDKPQKKNDLEEFLEYIDETGELLDFDEPDSIKEERMLRTDRISLALNERKYKEFSKARNVSFINTLPKNKTFPFKRWVDPINQLQIEPSAVDILAHMAYGIVGHIVDMALLARQDSQRTVNDPTGMVEGAHINSMMFNIPPVSKHEKEKDLSQNWLPITVDEVHEVVRRCYTPQVGYLRFTNKSMTARKKYFCI